MHVSFYKYEKTILISQGNGGEGVDKAVGKAADDLLQAACSIFYKRVAVELAHMYGLMCTGGSDYHGCYGAPSRVGERCISADEAGSAVAELFEREQGLA